MRFEREETLTTLREIEKQARALGEELPRGVERHRARQIAILAAHGALMIDLQHPRRDPAANDAGRGERASQA